MEISALKGVGPKTIINLNKLNIYTIKDILEYYPFRLQVYKVINLEEVEDNKDVTLRGLVETVAKVLYLKRNFNKLSFRANCNNKVINVVIFNRSFLKPHLYIGRSILLYGKYDISKNTFVASDIKFNIKENILIEPRYHLVRGISNKDIRRLINNALLLDIPLDDYVPKSINEKYDLMAKKIALNHLHNPSNITSLKNAKLKIIYEELFLFMFKILYLKQKSTKLKGLKRNVNWDEVEEYINTLPFKLTTDQLKSVKDIYEDLNANIRMNRLLLGDVGSGKTVVAVIGMYINYLSNFQSALMVPTEILAIQHYNNIITLLEETDIKVELLLGSMSTKEKNRITSSLQKGTSHIVIGTNAIIQNKVGFANLGLVITDEQHRFGVNQRSSLTNKGIMPDVLYMSATPIPRTYALTIYGDMQTSLIKTKPKGRKEIKTIVKKEADIHEVLSAMLEEIKLGHQIYVVAPTIEESETDLYDVNDLKTKIDSAYKNKIKSAVIHGKIKNEEKEKIMHDFKENKISILIATTVIEVGIDVMNATMIVIFDAQMFGLATLHQLRGRVGRSDLESTCYLICNSEVSRLRVLEESNDGFYISEKDFEMRGSGDLFGIKQSGDMVFKMADLKRDKKILLQASKDVKEFIASSEYKNNDLYKKLLEKLNFIE